MNIGHKLVLKMPLHRSVKRRASEQWYVKWFYWNILDPMYTADGGSNLVVYIICKQN